MQKYKKPFYRKRIINKKALENNQRLIILVIMFCFGLYLGAHINKLSDSSLSENIKNMTENLITKRSAQSFLNSFISFLIPDILILILSLSLGISLAGEAGLILLPVFKGYTLGLICGSLILNYSLNGFYYALILIAVPSAFSVSAIIISCKENMLSSKELRSIVKGEKNVKPNYKMLLIRNLILIILISFSALIYAVLNTFAADRFNPLA